MAEHAVQQRQPALLIEAARALGEHPLPDREVAEQTSLLGQPDLGAIGELARAAEVVSQRSSQQQVGVQARMQLAELVRERRYRDRVLEQAAEVGVVAGTGAGRPAPLPPQRIIGEQRIEQLAVSAVVDLAREMLEEAVQLVEIAVGRGQELGRVELVRWRRTLDLDDLDHELVAEALDAAGDVDEVPALEATGERIGVLERARGHRPAPIP